MSEHALGLLLAGIVAGTMPARAQDPVELRARVTRLERELREAEAAVARRDSLTGRSRLTGADTVTVGALRVVVPAGLPPSSRDIVARVWTMVDATFGSAAAVLADHPFTLVVDDPRSETRRRVGITNPVLTARAPEEVELRLIWAVSTALNEQADAALSAWLQGTLVPTPDPSRERQSVYVNLVTAPSPAARSCFVGELAGCRAVLGLAEAPDVFEQWYDPPRRRRIVQQMENLEEVRGLPRTFSGCVADHADADCLAVLRAVPPDLVPPPLPPGARISLARTALALGGRGSYARLIGTRGRPVNVRLAAASGVETDSLVAAWRNAILGARPQPVAVEPRGAWVALAWGIVFGLVALRSSRWR
ncbi:MAG TPA: hypothetical protein VGQ06_07010 [Gemmatimonadales bacterium]|jgi:hypothetical protein|nr:hypothetical protein [Gemmatimonadales bacterium]